MKWANQQMMMVPMPMGSFGSFGEHFSKGWKGKEGKGAKAGMRGKGQAQGKGGLDMMMCHPSAFTPDQSWHNPQPSFPCPECGPKDPLLGGRARRE